MEQQFAIDEGEDKSTKVTVNFSPRFMRASDIINCRREKRDIIRLVYFGMGGGEKQVREIGSDACRHVCARSRDMKG